jgi:hypothetical protein
LWLTEGFSNGVGDEKKKFNGLSVDARDDRETTSLKPKVSTPSKLNGIRSSRSIKKKRRKKLSLSQQPTQFDVAQQLFGLKNRNQNQVELSRISKRSTHATYEVVDSLVDQFAFVGARSKCMKKLTGKNSFDFHL